MTSVHRTKGLEWDYVNGAPDGDLLLGCVQRHGGHRHITRLLLEQYLPQIGLPELVGQVQKIVEGQEATSFAYKRSYQTEPEERLPSTDEGFEPSDAWKYLAATMKRQQKRKPD